MTESELGDARFDCLNSVAGAARQHWQLDIKTHSFGTEKEGHFQNKLPEVTQTETVYRDQSNQM